VNEPGFGGHTVGQFFGGVWRWPSRVPEPLATGPWPYRFARPIAPVFGFVETASAQRPGLRLGLTIGIPAKKWGQKTNGTTRHTKDQKPRFQESNGRWAVWKTHPARPRKRISTNKKGPEKAGQI